MLRSSHQEQGKENRARLTFYRVWTVIGLLVFVYVLGFLMNTLSMPIAVIVWTAIIVMGLSSPVRWLEKKGIKRIFGTTIAYVSMFLLLGAFFTLLFSPVFGLDSQFRNLLENVPVYFSQVINWFEEINATIFGFPQNDLVDNLVKEATTAITAMASQLAKSSSETIVAIGSSIVSFVVIIAFALIVAFWILMELPALGRECRRLVSGKREQDAEMLYVTFSRVIGGFVKATLLQSFLIAIGCGIAYTIMGLPNPAALAGIVGLLNIIPVIGGWLGAAVPAIVGLFISPVIALVAFIVTIGIQLFIYAFIYPRLMADSVNVHPVLVILAMLFGLSIGSAMNGLMGSLVGMLLAIPLAAAIKAIFVYYFEKRTGRQIVAEDGVFFKGVPANLDDSEIDPIADATAPAQASPPSVLPELKGDGVLANLRKKPRAKAQADKDPQDES
ncbi:MAG: AI-2E family transporter [Eggerthellaceae bacterium]|nr:AI-2E family transporter [Eggerthellaceae bacterium]